MQGVGRHFGALKAVDSVDLAVEDGEFLTLLGRSGCGKTTTLRMVAGLERNDTGTIVIGGRMVSDAAADLFVPPDQRKLGMVFQSYAIWPHMTVVDNVAFPFTVGKHRGSSRADVAAAVQRALAIVDLDGFQARSATRLSGGQQQRVAIARALLRRPRQGDLRPVVLTDEYVEIDRVRHRVMVLGHEVALDLVGTGVDRPGQRGQESVQPR